LLYTWCTTITPRQLIADSSSSSNKRKKTAMWRCCGYQLNFQSQQATEIFKPSNGPSTTQRGPTKGTRSHSKTSNTEFGESGLASQQNLGLHRILSSSSSSSVAPFINVAASVGQPTTTHNALRCVTTKVFLSIN
jgi:hypothetical protein